MQRGENCRELRHHATEQKSDQCRGGDEDDHRIDERSSGGAAQFGIVAHMRRQRTNRRRQLRGRFAGGHDGGEVRRKLPLEKTAGDVDRRALGDFAVDFFQHEPHGSRWCVGGKLAKGGVGIHAGTELQFQLVQEPDELRRRQDQARQLPVRRDFPDPHGPERLGAEMDPQDCLAGRVLPENPADARTVDDVDGESGHVRAGAAPGSIFRRRAAATVARCGAAARRPPRCARPRGTR